MGDKDNKLEITNAAYDASGKYVCTAKNILGEDKKEVKLLVEGTFRTLLFAFVTQRPYCPGRPKKLCFTTLSLAPTV